LASPGRLVGILQTSDGNSTRQKHYFSFGAFEIFIAYSI
jgi:hypothetical protein